jgi:hypothetical protein
MSLYNPSKYEDRSKDIADHVKTKPKNKRNIHNGTKGIGCSYDDRNVTSNGEIFMLTIMKT